MTRADCIHILRNPYGYSQATQREAALLACDEIERLEDSYLNMKKWAEANGIDTICLAS